MSGRRGVFSPDPIERRDAFRRVFRRACALRDLELAPVGRMLGYPSQPRFQALMTDGERASLAAADEPLASEIIGVDLRAQLVAETRPAAPALLQPAESVAAAYATLTRENAALSASVARVIVGSITPSQAAELQRHIEETRRALGQLEAAISYRVVEAPDRSAR